MEHGSRTPACPGPKRGSPMAIHAALGASSEPRPRGRLKSHNLDTHVLLHTQAPGTGQLISLESRLIPRGQGLWGPGSGPKNIFFQEGQCVDAHVCECTHTDSHTHTLLLPALWPAAPADHLGKGEFLFSHPTTTQGCNTCHQASVLMLLTTPSPSTCGPIKVCSSPCQVHGPPSCNDSGPDLSHLLKKRSESVAVGSYLYKYFCWRKRLTIKIFNSWACELMSPRHMDSAAGAPPRQAGESTMFAG